MLANMREKAHQCGLTVAIGIRELDRLAIKNWSCLIVDLFASTQNAVTNSLLVEGSFGASSDVTTILLDGCRELDGIVRNERKVIDSISQFSRQLEERKGLGGLKI